MIHDYTLSTIIQHMCIVCIYRKSVLFVHYLRRRYYHDVILGYAHAEIQHHIDLYCVSLCICTCVPIHVSFQ